MTRDKEKAVATANSDRPTKKNIYKQNYNRFHSKMQVVSPFVNGVIMRTAGHSRLRFSTVNDMQKALSMLLGIEEKEFWLSVNYLTEMDYLTQFIDAKSKLFLGDQLGVTYNGAGLLVGAIEDKNVAI